MNNKTDQLIYKNLKISVIKLFIVLFLTYGAGFRFSKPGSSEYYIDTIGVNKEHSGKGLAKILLAEVEKRPKSLTCRSLMVNVYKKNIIAIKAYEKMGFIKKERDGYHPLYEMAKNT